MQILRFAPVQKTNTLDWFKNWFDSKYYHVLYRHRNLEEAGEFMTNILEFISPEPGSRILDLACGKGRHSIFLNKKGYDVVGVDLSKNSIQEAKKNENPTLHFQQMDMRELECEKPFDMVFNLFTSFGYFQKESDHLAVINGVHRVLKTDGIFILDFLNAHLVLDHLVPNAFKTVDGVDFAISKFVDNDTVVKQIEVADGDYRETFQERVHLFVLEDFQRMFADSGFELVAHFGNYQLDPYDSSRSERLILLARKRN